MSAWSWLDAMIRQYGVQLLFTAARVIGFGLSLWLTVVVVNWYRNRDERRNVNEKARKIIVRTRADRDYWRQQAEDAERLAGDRLAIIRASMAAINHAGVQLRGATDAGDEPVVQG